MPWRRIVTQQVGLSVSAVCEACGEPFSYKRTVTGSADGASGLIFGDSWQSLKQKSQTALQAELASRFGRKDFGYVPCPACGYIQSWQKQSYLSASSLAAFLHGFLLLLSALCAAPYLTMLIWELAGEDFAVMMLLLYSIGFSAAAVGFGLLARRELKKRLEDTPSRVSPALRQPQVALAKPGAEHHAGEVGDDWPLRTPAMTTMLDYIGPSSTSLECPKCNHRFEPPRYRTGLEVSCPSCGGKLTCPDRDGVVRFFLNGLWMFFAAFTPLIGLLTSKFVFDMIPDHMRRLTKRGFWIRVLLLQGFTIALMALMAILDSVA